MQYNVLLESYKGDLMGTLVWDSEKSAPWAGTVEEAHNEALDWSRRNPGGVYRVVPEKTDKAQQGPSTWHEQVMADD